MILIPDNILTQYDAILLKRSVPATCHASYKKWLRYYWDFCGKYPVPDSKSDRVRLFIDKLRDKKQTPEQQKQAAHAVALYCESLQKAGDPARRHPVTEKHVAPVHQKRPSPEGSGGGPVSFVQSSDWEKVHVDLSAEIKTRHYSPKTLKAYALWTRQFQRFLRYRPPQEVSSVEVKEYLPHLAVQGKVSAATQNQAFNARLFLFRHLFIKDCGDHRDIPRARRTRYLPVVLARQGIEDALKHLSPPSDLVIKRL